jgi:hypothetical protein
VRRRPSSVARLPGYPGHDAVGTGSDDADWKHHQFVWNFGSATGAIDLSYGGANWGNFIEIDGLNTGRFLDPPEFKVFHDKGNEENVFDRVDRSFTDKDSVHTNLNYSRSWFQTPNSYDNLNVQNVLSGGATANPFLAMLVMPISVRRLVPLILLRPTRAF